VEDAWLVIGMNRLRHAYVELAPEIEQYLVTGRYDDEAGVLQTYGFRPRIGVTHLFAGSPIIIGMVDALISGVLVAIVGQSAAGTAPPTTASCRPRARPRPASRCARPG